VDEVHLAEKYDLSGGILIYEEHNGSGLQEDPLILRGRLSSLRNLQEGQHLT